MIASAAALLLASLAGGTAAAADGKLSFSPLADARVKEAYPNTNYGSLPYLRVDGDRDPGVKSYLRFAVSGVSGPVKSAKLRLYAYTETLDGPAIYLTSNAWSEQSITWNNRPARIGTPSDNKVQIAIGTWVEYDVAPLVTGNGDVTFALVGDSTDGANFASKEYTDPSKKPTLEVTYGF